MNKIRHETLKIRGNAIGAPSVFPPLRNALDHKIVTELEENDEIFIGYGLLPNPLPYTMLDCYDTPETDLEFPVAVLENRHLKAVFLPTLGGRLWQLYDKDAGRDLVHTNPVFKPVNFAIRNAWFAGGIEWNCGRRGHDANTASPLFTAELELPDGTPVLRMYEFNRDRAVTYQMDFFLPEDSGFLFARMRIVNPNDHLTPMYWWSNIAVEERDGQRIIVPATSSYANSYVDDSHHALRKVPLPFNAGIDCTRPENHRSCKDHFFNIPAAERKFEAVIFADGYGLVQCSTDRLRGRKLFVWGRGNGGRHWQRKLTAPEGADYLEIQAGLGKTQMGCEPMPPGTAWEWLEAYGAMQVDPAPINGDWSVAVATVAERLETILPRRRLDELLHATSGTTLARKRGKLCRHGSGWGALECEMRSKLGLAPLPEYLDFGDCDGGQAEFLQLLETGSFGERDPETPPAGYLVQDEWFALLKRAATGSDSKNFYTHYHLGINYYQRGDMERAEQSYTTSLRLRENLWAHHALTNLYRVTGRLTEAARLFVGIVKFRSHDPSLIKEALKCCSEAGAYDESAEILTLLGDDLRNMPMIRFFEAETLAHTGELTAASAILLGPPVLDVPDIREGENSLSTLYLYIESEKSRLAGLPFRAADHPIPFEVDLRMS